MLTFANKTRVKLFSPEVQEVQGGTLGLKSEGLMGKFGGTWFPL